MFWLLTLFLTYDTGRVLWCMVVVCFDLRPYFDRSLGFDIWQWSRVMVCDASMFWPLSLFWPMTLAMCYGVVVACFWYMKPDVRKSPFVLRSGTIWRSLSLNYTAWCPIWLRSYRGHTVPTMSTSWGTCHTKIVRLWDHGSIHPGRITIRHR